MKTKKLLLLLTLIVFTITVKAQLADKKFELKLGEMGTYYIEFSETDYKLANPKGDLMVAGTYKIDGNTIMFTDKEGMIACPAVNVGEYRYSMADGELKLELIKDECTGRSQMAAVSWKQVEK